MKINDEDFKKMANGAETAVDIVEGVGVGFVTEAAVCKMLMPLMPTVGTKVLCAVGAAALAHAACCATSNDNQTIKDFTTAFWALRNAVKEASGEEPNNV